MMTVERVQTMATQTIDAIPTEFIRSKKEQPGLTTYTGPLPDIPTIDLSDPDKDHLVRLITNARKEWGFFEITNHGIPFESIQKLQQAGKEFFELPAEEKEVYAKTPDAESIEGYGNKLQKEIEGKKAWVDHLFHNIWPPHRINYKFWPKNPSYYRFHKGCGVWTRGCLNYIQSYINKENI